MLYQAMKTWMKLLNILLSETKEFEKAAYCVMSTTLYSGTGRTMGMVKRSVDNGDWGGRDGKIEHRGFLEQ
jgi:hypothetical protein